MDGVYVSGEPMFTLCQSNFIVYENVLYSVNHDLLDCIVGLKLSVKPYCILALVSLLKFLSLG